MKKNMIYRVAFATAVLVLVCAGLAIAAQGGDKYETRLAPAPALALTAGGPKPNTAGIGVATATLSGKKLTISGTFEKLTSSATAANLCLGIVTGARGDCGTTPPAVNSFALSISPGTMGALNGAVDLNNEQVDALKKGRYYISIHSQGVPTGHLLGWLLPAKGK